MPPKRRMSREERRQSLVAAAEQLFAQDGYRRTEVGQIARNAGVTKPVLYQNFPSGKSEIYKAVLDECGKTLMETLWRAMALSGDPRDRMHKGLDAYLEFVETNPGAFHLMAEGLAGVGEGVKEHQHAIRNSIIRGVANTIGDIMASAGLDRQWAPLYAFAMIGAAESVAGWWLQNSHLERSVVSAHLLALVWRGFENLPMDPSQVAMSQLEAGQPFTQ